MKMKGQVCFDLRRSLPAAEVNRLAGAIDSGTALQNAPLLAVLSS
jgi:hypothetical protein